MLINLNNNGTWINKNHIVGVTMVNNVKKPDFVDYVGKDDNEEDLWWLFGPRSYRDDYAMVIGKFITINLIENKSKSIFIGTHNLTINDLDLEIDTNDKFLNLCKATKDLQTEQYDYILINDNEFMRHFNILLKDEDKTNELGVKHCLEEYLSTKEENIVAKQIREKVINNIKSSYIYWATR